MRVRALSWNDFEGWVELYLTRYEEIGRNPDLGVYLQPTKPTLPEEAALFGQVMKQVLAGDRVVSVAEAEGKLVGVCMVARRGHHLEDRHLGDLGIALHPGWRGRGFGDALMRDALEKCRGIFEVVELKVVALNEGAVRLYRKHGFEVYGREPRAFKRGDRYLDEFLMRRDIEPRNPAADSG